MTSISSNIAATLQASQQRVSQAATEVTSAAFKKVGVSQEIFDLELGKQQFKAGAKLLQVQQQLQERLIDILA